MEDMTKILKRFTVQGYTITLFELFSPINNTVAYKANVDTKNGTKVHWFNEWEKYQFERFDKDGVVNWLSQNGYQVW